MSEKNDFDFPSSAPATYARPKAKKEEVKEPAAKDTPAEADKAKQPPKYSPEELMKVFDAIIFQGDYSESFSIKGKFQVVLRTRTQKEIAEITKQVDAMDAKLVSTMEQHRAILNLQCALVQYGPRDLSTVSWEDKAKMIEKLPGPIIGALLTALGNFDDKVYQACQEGEANF